MTQYWGYWRLHIPSGKRWACVVDRFSPDCIRHRTLSDALDYWNGSQPGMWQYWQM